MLNQKVQDSQSTEFQWIYPYLCAYLAAMDVGFLGGVPVTEIPVDAEDRLVPAHRIQDPEDAATAPVREWVDHHLRLISSIMGGPFRSLGFSSSSGSQAKSGTPFPGRYVALAAATDAVDEMIRMLGRQGPDGRNWVYLSELPLALQSMDQSSDGSAVAVRALGAWAEGGPSFGVHHEV